MKSSNRRKMGDFERKWSEAFEGAEATPSDELWTNIHANLANSEVATYKKRMVYYRWAAVVALLLLIGVSTYTLTKTDPKVVTEQSASNQRSDNESSSVSNPEENNQITGDDNKIFDHETSIEDQNSNNNAPAQKDDQHTSNPNINSGTEPAQAVEGLQETLAQNQSQSDLVDGSQSFNTVHDKGESSDPRVNKQKLPTLITTLDKDTKHMAEVNAEKPSHPAESTWVVLDGLGAEVSTVEVSPELAHIYLLPLARVNEPVNKEKTPTLWAGLSFAPGSFDPNYRQQAAETQLVAAAAPNARSSFIVKEDSHPGSSVAMGMDVGVNMSDRWKITSGVQYFNSSVKANTNAVAAASNTPVYNSFSSYDLSSAKGANSGRYIFAPDTDLQSTFEFLSIPVEAGYVVLDRKVQLVLNAGIGTNIFIKNNIQDKQNTLADVTITPGEGAPFKSVYFNGLMGVEALYGIGDQFNISLKPQYRTAINDFTKSNSEFSSRPSTFGVSLGVQYNIK